MFTVVFVEPESSGNIGALARAMKNFGLRELILVNPKCKIDKETRNRAKHANDLLEKARIVKSFEKIGSFDFVIGTTGKIAKHYDEVRHSISPKELAGQMKTKGNIAIVFGREGMGLTNKELSLCDIIVHIPTDERYPVMNVSHAAAIVFYELFSNKQKQVIEASGKEKEVLFDYFGEIVNSLAVIRDKKKVIKIFKNIVNRSMIAGKEAHALAGALGEIRKKI